MLIASANQQNLLYVAICVEGEHYIPLCTSICYHVRSTVAQNFPKGGVHARCVNVSSIHEFTQHM